MGGKEKMFEDAIDKIERAAEDLGLALLWGEPILPGDWYLACRNTDAKFLTCQIAEGSLIIPVEPMAYPFDTCDCVKVVENKRVF
jgi:hypothetical protein